MRKNNLNKTLPYIKRNFSGYILMLPYLCLFFIFVIWPVLYSLVLSFTSFNVFEAPKFVGMDNYIHLFFQDDVFLTSVQNTFVLSLAVGPLGYFLSLFLAWAVNDLNNPWKSILTAVFYAPVLSGGAFSVWAIFFDGDIYGYLNNFLIKTGIIKDAIQWTSDPTYMMTVVIIVQLWFTMGTSFLTLRSGFNTIDRQYYEAASVDGIRNRWQELWYITLPIMAPHLMLAAVLAITSTFGSEQVASVMTGFPSTNYATHTIMSHLKDYGLIRYQRGYAAAIATILFLVSLIANKLAQKAIQSIGKV